MILKKDIELMQSWKSLYTQLLEQKNRDEVRLLISELEQDEPILVKFSSSFDKTINNHCNIVFERYRYIDHDSRMGTRQDYKKKQVEMNRQKVIRLIFSCSDDDIRCNLLRIDLYFQKIKTMAKKGRYYVVKD